ncbi:hypothetical protein EV426DRAFT_675684 [Tirmania nivea]|nr:hypothetical protein EV426DRAFT_675684 [Tirmania nivea]
MTHYCAHLYLDFTGVEQLHVCSAPKHCRRTEHLFPDAELVAAVERQMKEPGTFVPTVWALDGRSIIGKDQPFIAISHVWSMLWGLAPGPAASSMSCPPTEKKARIYAINNMHNNYTRAAVTLVHDRYLSNMRWISPAEASFTLVMSPWFTRGCPGTGDDILTSAGEVTHAYHHVASDLIRRVMGKVNTLNDLLTALGPRYTSWARDKAIIAGLLVGVTNPASLSQIEVYQAVLMRLSKVEIGNLFHGRTTMRTHGFHWCPSDAARPCRQPTTSRERQRRPRRLYFTLYASNIERPSS